MGQVTGQVTFLLLHTWHTNQQANAHYHRHDPNTFFYSFMHATELKVD